ncbi:MAG: CDP-diacylglycerol--serine O-phosphatidyltransferase [Nitrospirae bacterium]|nr:CDP-diacylglycerol--serine O-phosphatidyltransferase [Nitrospirota bacterium]
MVEPARIVRLDGLRKGIYLLPNLLTTFSLFSGFYSIVATFQGNHLNAAIAILVSAFFDASDGKVARLTHTTSRFGVEYDSLADLVAFGVAPAFLIYHWALGPWGRLGWLAAFLFMACGALRLARFNVQFDSVEHKWFTGLPIPGAAAMVASTYLLYNFLGKEVLDSRKFVFLAMAYLLALLMVSTIRYPSFKEVEFIQKKPIRWLALFVLAITFVVWQPEPTFFVGMLTYVCTGPVGAIIRKVKGLREPQEEDLKEIEDAGDVF